MKAISLTQPWASAVAIGLKRVETRSWATAYRGDLLIHAARSYPAWARQFAMAEWLAGSPFEFPLPRGVIVARARLATILPTEAVVADLDERELRFGNYAPGRYAWVLEDIEPLAHPITARGALGLWNVEL